MTTSKTYDMISISLFAVILAVCSWISIPTVVPFTMQTFGLFLTLNVLGGKRGTFAVVVFILLGAVGIPVFSGFTGGLGILLGNTGGYILGFVLTSLLYWAMEHFLGTKSWVQLTAMVLGLILCYVFGTLWFLVVYTKSTGPVGMTAVIGWCVAPFVLPDIAKLTLAWLVSKRLKRIEAIH